MEITKEHINWLRGMRDEAQRNLGKTREKLEAIQKEFETAQQELATWHLAYGSAKDKAGIENQEEPQAEIQPSKQPPRLKFREGSIPHIAARLLSQAGTATADEIHHQIILTGKSVDPLSVDSALHRYQPEFFLKDGYGKWKLAGEAKASQKGSPEAIEPSGDPDTERRRWLSGL